MYRIKETLNGKWKLYISENKRCSEFADSIYDEASLKVHGLNYIPANVPGNFELDMQTAGMIDDPFYGDNTLKIQELENRHLWYSTTFNYAGESPERVYISFEGIDTFPTYI